MTLTIHMDYYTQFRLLADNNKCSVLINFLEQTVREGWYKTYGNDFNLIMWETNTGWRKRCSDQIIDAIHRIRNIVQYLLQNLASKQVYDLC